MDLAAFFGLPESQNVNSFFFLNPLSLIDLCKVKPHRLTILLMDTIMIWN